MYLSASKETNVEFIKIKEDNTYSYDYTLIRNRTSKIVEAGKFPWLSTTVIVEKDTLYQCDCPNKP